MAGPTVFVEPVLHQGRVAILKTGPTTPLEIDGVPVPGAEGLLGHFPRAVSASDVIVCGMRRGTDDHDLVVRADGVVLADLGKANGNYSIATEAQADGSVLAVSVHPDATYRRMTLRVTGQILTDEILPLPPDQIEDGAPTSQGIRALINGDIHWTTREPYLAIGPEAIRVYGYQEIGGWVVGMLGDYVALYDAMTGVIRRAAFRTPVNPRIALDPALGPTVGVTVTGGGGVVLHDIDFQPIAAYLQPMRRAFLWGTYAFNRTAAPPGNACTPIRQNRDAIDPADLAYIDARAAAGQHILLPSDMPPSESAKPALYFLYAGEDGATSTEVSIDQTRPKAQALGLGVAAYQDSLPVRQSVVDALRPGDVLMPQFYRTAGDDGGWEEAFRTESRRLAPLVQQKGAALLPVLGLHNRNGTIGPFRATELIVWASVQASEDGWYGADGFRVGTADLLAEALDLFIQWCSLATVPAPLPVEGGGGGGPDPGPDPGPTPEPEPEPEPEDDMAAIGQKLPETFKSVKEIDAGGGEVALELPDLIHGHKKIKSTTPGGIDEYRPKSSPQDPGGDDRDWTPNDIGPWEKYKKTATAYVAEREDKGKISVFVYPRV